MTTETVHIPYRTIISHEGVDYLCRDGVPIRPATGDEKALWYQKYEFIEEIGNWLVDGCPGRDWSAGVMPGANGNGKLPD